MCLFRRFMLFLCPVLAVSLLGPHLVAAPQARAEYYPRITFAPLTLAEPVNAYRSSNGAPGPSYWQNEADYDLHASLDTAAKQSDQQTRPSATPITALTPSKPLDTPGTEHLYRRIRGRGINGREDVVRRGSARRCRRETPRQKVSS